MKLPRLPRRRVAAVAATSAVVAFALLCDVENTNDALSVRRLASSSPSVEHAAAAAAGGGRGSSPAVVSVPLVPHKALLDRRLRELGEAGASKDHPSSLLVEPERTPDGRNGERRYGRSRALSPSSPRQQVDALYQGYGTHYVDLWIGSPLQRQTVIVDTGSSVTAFPCSHCVDCGEPYHTDRYFRESESESFRRVGCDEGCEIGSCMFDLGTAIDNGNDEGGGWTCGTKMRYAEGSSWVAYEGRDVAYVGGPHSEPLPAKEGDDGSDVDGADPTAASDLSFELSFGCQTSLTGLFRTQLADGIMGMDADSPSLWYQMSSKGVLLEEKFALCFGKASVADKGGTEAGAMTMGGADDRFHLHPMVFASMEFSEGDAGGWYVVTLKGMYLRTGGGDSVVPTVTQENESGPEMVLVPVEASPEILNNGKVIVDSGTTLTYLSAHLRKPFSEAWEKITGVVFTNDPVHLTDEEVKGFPTILIQLSGGATNNKNNLPADSPGLAGDLDPSNPTDVVIAIPPLHYMEYSPSTDTYSCRFYFNERSGGVLGANAMMGKDVLFDMEKKRMGFAESDCDYKSVVSMSKDEGAATTEKKKNRAG